MLKKSLVHKIKYYIHCLTIKIPEFLFEQCPLVFNIIEYEYRSVFVYYFKKFLNKKENSTLVVEIEVSDSRCKDLQ